MLLDELVPAWDATRIEHRVVPGTLEQVFAIALDADFLDAARQSPAVKFLFAARNGAERVVGVFRADDRAPAETPESLRLREMSDHGDWVRLGVDPPREIAFGVIGRFWAGETVWEQIASDEFTTFDRPDFAKIGCNLSFREYGAARTLVSYEARTVGTDDTARRGFLRYWRIVDPFVGVVMRAMLSVIEQRSTVSFTAVSLNAEERKARSHG